MKLIKNEIIKLQRIRESTSRKAVKASGGPASSRTDE